MQIIDWTAVVAGPLTSRVLVDMGADVIRIEQVAKGEILPRGINAATEVRRGLPAWDWDPRSSARRGYQFGQVGWQVTMAASAGGGVFPLAENLRRSLSTVTVLAASTVPMSRTDLAL